MSRKHRTFWKPITPKIEEQNAKVLLAHLPLGDLVLHHQQHAGFVLLAHVDRLVLRAIFKESITNIESKV